MRFLNARNCLASLLCSVPVLHTSIRLLCIMLLIFSHSIYGNHVDIKLALETI
jgi:hypothetical protein